VGCSAATPSSRATQPDADGASPAAASSAERRSNAVVVTWNASTTAGARAHEFETLTAPGRLLFVFE
jgi:hypothetical protein